MGVDVLWVLCCVGMEWVLCKYAVGAMCGSGMMGKLAGWVCGWLGERVGGSCA